MKKKIVSCLLVGVMCTLIGSVAYADESGSTSRADNIKSHGTLLCEQAGAENNVLIASQDLNYLADEIDELEDSYKRTATDSLAVIGQNPVSTLWSDICSAIEHSQDVSTGTTADNLSKDKGAWVNGEYITGNGADNKTNYNQGYTDGFNKAMNGASISYVYHTHTDSCYTYHSGHHHSDECGTSHWYHDWDCSDDGTGCHGHVTYNCGKEESSGGYRLSCGKNNSTIESATITFP